MSYYSYDGTVLTLAVRVQPRASRDGIVGARGDRLCVRLSSPPVDGKANAELIALLAKSFGASKSRVRIVQGLRGRDKTVLIEAPRRWPHAHAPDGILALTE